MKFIPFVIWYTCGLSESIGLTQIVPFGRWGMFEGTFATVPVTISASFFFKFPSTCYMYIVNNQFIGWQNIQITTTPEIKFLLSFHTKNYSNSESLNSDILLLVNMYLIARSNHRVSICKKSKLNTKVKYVKCTCTCILQEFEWYIVFSSLKFLLF